MDDDEGLGIPVDDGLDQRLTNSIDNENTKFEVQDWSEDQEVDPNLPHNHRTVHSKSVNLNNRFYVFQNLSASNKRAIKVVDPCLRRIFQIPLIGEENKIKESRINYSISHMNNKVYLYGGLNDRNEVLSNMEMFDACTYKFSEVNYRLEARVAGR